jgi:3',5'-cyclic AMP phosphodiesterase CpdA
MILVASALLLLACGEILYQKTESTLLTGPMVQFPSPDRLTVVWEMKPTVFSEGVVHLKADGQNRTQQVHSADGRRYEATFEGLSPDTPYEYTVLQHALIFNHPIAGPYPVRTPPGRGKTFRFLAFGDSGNGSNTQYDLAKLMAAAKPDVIIHTGDLVYPSGNIHDYPGNFFEPYVEMIRRIPFMPSLGNHDAATEHGKPLLDVFVLPGNGPPDIEPERNYWFDFGDARFVALDSNPQEDGGVITADQRKNLLAPWLRQVLTQTDAHWKFVYYHHPFYTGSVHPAEGALFMKEPFVGVFEDGGVDVVFCGHNHLYERTAPMRQDKIAAEGQGVVYVVTGAGGVSRYKEHDPPPPYMKAFNDAVFSFTQVDLSADRLRLRQIGDTGNVVDEYVITKPQPGRQP